MDTASTPAYSDSYSTSHRNLQSVHNRASWRAHRRSSTGVCCHHGRNHQLCKFVSLQRLYRDNCRVRGGRRSSLPMDWTNLVMGDQSRASFFGSRRSVGAELLQSQDEARASAAWARCIVADSTNTPQTIAQRSRSELVSEK